MAIIINETDLSTGTYYEVMEVSNVANIAFQYKLIAGTDNILELQFWSTVYIDADDSTDGDWVNVTEFLTEEEELIVEDETINDMAITDSNVPFAKVKIKYIVTADNPDNTIKIGWNCDR